MKIQFIKDYTLTVNNLFCKDGMIGCQPTKNIDFKLGQVISGGIRGGSLDSKNFYIDYGDYTKAIPLEYVKVLNDDGTPYAIQKLVNSQEKQQPFLDKHKNHLLIAVALVAGYFAYKKFKK